MTTLLEEIEQIEAQLPEGSRFIDIEVYGYVEKIDGDDAFVVLDGGNRSATLRASYVKERGLDDGNNKSFALAVYRHEGSQKKELVRWSRSE